MHQSWKWLIAPEKGRAHVRDSITDLCSNHLIPNPKWVEVKVAKILPKCVKGAPEVEKKQEEKVKRGRFGRLLPRFLRKSSQQASLVVIKAKFLRLSTSLPWLRKVYSNLQQIAAEKGVHPHLK